MSRTPGHIVTLMSVPSEAEAGIIIAALDNEGIPATMTGTYTAGFRAEAPGRVQINVAETSLSHAKEVVRDAQNAGEVLDWSSVHVGEPDISEDASDKPYRFGLAGFRRLNQILNGLEYVPLWAAISLAIFVAWLILF